MPIWVVRWIDRLDCSGPSFLPRQYLKLAFHEGEFDGQGFYESNFFEAMNPKIKNIDSDGKKKNVVEHITRYSNTQNNDSVYGQHDFGAMIEIRNGYLGHVKKIIQSFDQSGKNNFSTRKMDVALKLWNCFLMDNIESGKFNQRSVLKLSSEFMKLPDNFISVWYKGIVTNMNEYKKWSADLEEACYFFKREWLTLPGISDNILNILRPSYKWKNEIESLF